MQLSKTLPLLVLFSALFHMDDSLACEKLTPCTSATCFERMDIDNRTVKVYRNYPLQSAICEVNHAVVVIHGSSRNADDYFSRMISAATTSGNLDTTLVVAPNFVTTDDGILSSDLYWSSGGWKKGNTSNNSVKVSSFEVVDRLVDGIKRQYPDIRITLIGHSAGGQFINRYASGGAHSDMHFVVANPSSYMYLTEHRPVSGRVDRFETFDGSGCSSFNDYKYGLVGRNAYMRAHSNSDLIGNYVQRNVTYMLGSEDVERSSSLATSCSADLQGYNRLERGQAFFNYMNTYFGDNSHRFVLVDGVGHSSTGMFNSPEGIDTVFGNQEPESVTNTPPVAAFTYLSDDDDVIQINTAGDITMVDEGDGDEDLAFTANASWDPDGDSLTFSWDIAGTAASGETTPQYIFYAGITYPVTLTVTDARGATDSKSINVEVVTETSANAAPSAPANLSVPVRGEDRLFLSWTASSDSDGQVTGYHIFRNGAAVAFVSDTSYEDTGLAADTIHDYYVQAVDDDGALSAASNVVTASTLSVSSVDTTAPTVAITSPAPGATLESGSTILVAASASDDVAVSHVEFYVDGRSQCTDADPEYTCHAKLTGEKNKAIQIRVLAYDAAGNVGEHTITVTQDRETGPKR